MPVSLDFVRAAYARQTPDIALLVTIDADGLEEPLRASSWPANIPGTNRQGLVSRGQEYPFFPFDFSWNGSGLGEASRDAKLEISNADGRISEAVRTATEQPTVDVEAVRVAAPDLVELALEGAQLSSVEIDDTHAVGTLKARDFANEPACAWRYTSARFPALY